MGCSVKTQVWVTAICVLYHFVHPESASNSSQHLLLPPKTDVLEITQGAETWCHAGFTANSWCGVHHSSMVADVTQTTVWSEISTQLCAAWRQRPSCDASNIVFKVENGTKALVSEKAFSLLHRCIMQTSQCFIFCCQGCQREMTLQKSLTEVPIVHGTRRSFCVVCHVIAGGDRAWNPISTI